jgi:hypothetical protein
MLCFPTDSSWFQGNINTDDDSSYSIFGERLISSDTDNMIESDNNISNNNKGEKQINDDSHPIYKVTLTDHFTGLCYQLPDIQVNLDPNSPSLLTCSQDAQIKFKVEQVYKGQKADMMLQRYSGGSSALVGKKCLVYSGPISLLFQDTASTGKNWCL